MRKAIALVLAVAFAAVMISPLMAQEQIDVNTATATQLQRLHRVGPAISARIIEEREANGPFASLAELQQRVRGVGPATIAGWEGMAVAIPPQPAE